MDGEENEEGTGSKGEESQEGQEATEEAPEGGTESVSQGQEAKGEEDDAPVVGLEKALRDTQSWGSKGWSTVSALAEENELLRRKLSEATPKGDTFDPSTLDALASEIPDVKPLVQAFKQQQQMLEELAGRVAGPGREEVEQEKAREKNKAEVRRVHSDLDQILESATFGAWLQEEVKQGTAAALAIYGGRHIPDIVAAVQKYKDAVGQFKSKAQRDKEAAEAKMRALAGPRGGGSEPPASGPKKFSRSDIAKMSLADYRRYEKDILEAMEQKRISNR